MSRRHIPVAVAAVLLAVVALIGYAWPAPEPLLPVKALPDRVLLPNSAGKVVFDHKKHFEDYKVECQLCHHDREKPTPVAGSCRSCHGVAEQPDFRARHAAETAGQMSGQMSCVTCHHMEFAGTDWKHDEHKTRAGNDCSACHHADDRSRPEPQNCKTCHKAEQAGSPGSGDGGGGGKTALATAAHARCATAGCHADVFAPGSGMSNCSTCHSFVATRTTLRDKGWFAVNPEYADCAVCHTEQAVDDLVPGRMRAFHDSCMKCHEERGKGPFDQQSCNQCHTK